MANALRYTPAGGAVTLQAQPTDGGVRLVARDTGEGIPPEDLPYVFDRFWRGERTGAGHRPTIVAGSRRVHQRRE